jgi:membrane protein implicated in regulation of membrane protease activity
VNQSRIMSGAEAIANVGVGFVLAVVGQVIVFPVVGLEASLRQTLQVGAAFTALSLLRSYVLRRLFNRLRE